MPWLDDLVDRFRRDIPTYAAIWAVILVAFLVFDSLTGEDRYPVHELLVGMVDAAGHRELVRHIEERPGQPLGNGFPAGFRPLARIGIVKGPG